MHLSVGGVERLPSVPFVLMAGTIGGVLLSVTGSGTTTGVGTLAALLATVAAVVTLWWVTVRRRQHNAWSAGFHIACVIALAQLIALALIITGAVAPTEHLQWQDVVSKALIPQLVLTPLRFGGAVLLIAVGRRLPGSGRGTLPGMPASSSEHREGEQPGR